MIIELKEPVEARYVGLTGFRGVKVYSLEELLGFFKKIGAKHQVVAQLLNADLIATWRHLLFSVIHALKSFASHRNISNTVEIEILLYASAKRQIKDALDIVGIKLGTMNIAVVCLGSHLSQVESFLKEVEEVLMVKADESVLDIDDGKAGRLKECFNVKDREVEATSRRPSDGYEALAKCIYSRTALLTIRG